MQALLGIENGAEADDLDGEFGDEQDEFALEDNPDVQLDETIEEEPEPVVKSVSPSS